MVNMMICKKWIAMTLLLCLLVLTGCTPYKAPPEINTRPATQPSTEETQTNASEESQGKDWESILTYKEYLAMSKEEQSSFYDSFEDPNEFFSWFNAVKAIYDEERKENQFEGGSIDIGGMSGN